jgi:hypothetical protein
VDEITLAPLIISGHFPLATHVRTNPEVVSLVDAIAAVALVLMLLGLWLQAETSYCWQFPSLGQSKDWYINVSEAERVAIVG